MFLVTGFRPHWQFEDIVWYVSDRVFPVDNASCTLPWVVAEAENAKMPGVHCSAALLRWYENWVPNREKVTE